MKKYATLLSILFFVSCNCKKTATQASLEKTTAISPCPESGTCTLSYLKNKHIEFKTNEATGKQYHIISDSDTKNVIQYEYTRTVDPTLADGGHTEVIFFEVDAKNPETELSGKELQQKNMIFGRFCFCRGATGIYRVADGKLSVKKENDHLKVDLDFKITEVPQIITSFSGLIK